jgi:hypothetical protein
MLPLGFFFTSAFLPPDAQNAVRNAYLADLKSAWAQETGKIVTGEFSVEYFRIQDGGPRRISIARMRQFLEQAKLFGKLRQLRLRFGN